MNSTVGALFNGSTVGGINGAIGASYGVGTAFLPWYAGFLFDQTQTYTLPLWIAASVTIIAMICMLLAHVFYKARLD